MSNAPVTFEPTLNDVEVSLNPGHSAYFPCDVTTSLQNPQTPLAPWVNDLVLRYLETHQRPHGRNGKQWIYARHYYTRLDEEQNVLNTGLEKDQADSLPECDPDYNYIILQSTVWCQDAENEDYLTPACRPGLVPPLLVSSSSFYVSFPSFHQDANSEDRIQTALVNVVLTPRLDEFGDMQEVYDNNYQIVARDIEQWIHDSHGKDVNISFVLTFMDLEPGGKADVDLARCIVPIVVTDLAGAGIRVDNGSTGGVAMIQDRSARKDNSIAASLLMALSPAAKRQALEQDRGNQLRSTPSKTTVRTGIAYIIGEQLFQRWSMLLLERVREMYSEIAKSDESMSGEIAAILNGYVPPVAGMTLPLASKFFYRLSKYSDETVPDLPHLNRLPVATFSSMNKQAWNEWPEMNKKQRQQHFRFAHSTSNLVEPTFNFNNALDK